MVPKIAIAAAMIFSVFASIAELRAQVRPTQDATRNSSVAAGHAYAAKMCAQCHDISSRIDDQFAGARPPSFYAVANAKTTSAIGLNAFLVTPHAPMPNFIIEPGDRKNIIDYILSLRNESAPST